MSLRGASPARASLPAILGILFAGSVRASGETSGAVIESIEVRVQDVFEGDDGTPDYWPYRLANQVHVETREKVIRRELLFHEGDVLDPEALAQTERNLRALPFLRQARIEANPTGEDGRVRVRVVVSDSWTTVPEVRLAKVGDEFVWAVGASEDNLLGWGKQLAVMRSADLDREQTFASYGDPRLFGSRISLNALVSSASDGHQASIGAGRPFFSLGTLWSFRARVEDFDRLDPLYRDGVRIEDLRHSRTSGDVEVARAVYRSETSATRVHLGYQFSDDLVATDRRQFGTLRVGLTALQHSFLKLTHVNRFERTEDINLGNETAIFFGLSTPALGGEPGRSYFVSLSERRGLPVSRNGFLLGTVSWQARHRKGAVENSIARLRLDLVQKFSLRRLILAKADLWYGKNLDPEVQFRLGAESGLRGYPVRQFNGDRSLLFSVEARWFLVDDVARIVSIGIASFFDSGFAWPEGHPMVLRDLHSNAGVSLLLGGNRVSASRPGVRLDLAYAMSPLAGPDAGRSRWLFSAGSRLSF